MSHLLLLLLFAQAQPTFRSDVALVHVDAEVLQDRAIVAGLDKDSFRVTDNGKPQPIIAFGRDEEPLDVVLLFDARSGMRTVVAQVAAASRSALSDLREGDRVAVMAFGGMPGTCKTDRILDLTDDLDAAGRSIASQVLQREFRPNTNMCDVPRGLADAASQFLTHPGGNRRRAIVAITDDVGAPTKLSVVRRHLEDVWKADAVVLSVIVHSGSSVVSIGPPYRGARYFADKTGGDTANNPDAVEGLREMLHRLRSRYSLYYALPAGKSGEERKIQVQLTGDAAKRHPHATILARSGYVR